MRREGETRSLPLPPLFGKLKGTDIKMWKSGIILNFLETLTIFFKTIKMLTCAIVLDFFIAFPKYFQLNYSSFPHSHHYHKTQFYKFVTFEKTAKNENLL